MTYIAVNSHTNCSQAQAEIGLARSADAKVINCPKCNVAINKAGGCQFVRCVYLYSQILITLTLHIQLRKFRICQCNFCWKCGREAGFAHPIACPGEPHWGFLRRFGYRCYLILSQTTFFIFFVICLVLFGFATMITVLFLDKCVGNQSMYKAVIGGICIFIVGMILNCIIVPLLALLLIPSLIVLAITYIYDRIKSQQQA